MASRDDDDRARRRERERRRRERDQRSAASDVPERLSAPVEDVPTHRAGRSAVLACGWCGAAISPRSRGPIPKWCSATCRHRAWEQTRAAASGRAAVQLVERRIEVPTAVPPNRREWPRVLRELTAQLDDGRVYDRDLQSLSAALRSVLEAIQRRHHVSGAAYLG